MSDKGTKETHENAHIVKESHKSLFDNKENQIMLLKALFKYGYSNFPLEAFPSMSTEEVDEAIRVTLKKLHAIFKNTPSLIHWLHGGLFDSTESVPMALLFIEWYEQHPSQEDNPECNFRYYILFNTLH